MLCDRKKDCSFLSYDQKHISPYVVSSKTSVSDPLVFVIFLFGSLSVFSSYIHICNVKYHYLYINIYIFQSSYKLARYHTSPNILFVFFALVTCQLTIL